MLLVLDAGNAEIKAGCYEKDTLLFVCRMASDTRMTGDQYACGLKELFSLYGARPSEIRGAVLSSVVPALIPLLRQAVSHLTGCKVLTVGPGVKTGLNIKMDHPAGLGTDFVCGAVAALARHTPPIVVFDFGTATTVTALDAQGVLSGKAIMAGIGISLDALASRTASLPRVELGRPAGLFGRGTAEAINCGAVHGSAAMVDGLMQRYRQELGENLCCVLTGGCAQAVSPYCRTPHACEPDLLLYGLKLIYERNLPGA